MSYWYAGTTIVGLAGTAINNNQAKKAAQGAAGAGQVDIMALDAKAREIALRNAHDSRALEEAMTPEVPQLRTDANNQVLQQMNPSGVDEYSRNALASLNANPVGHANTPLLQAAIAKAKANLALGGQLSPEAQNAATRGALSTAGTVAPGGLGLGRDLTARDLGLTSMAIENERLAQAAQLGGQELSLAGLNTGTDFNNRAGLLNSISMLQGVQGNQFNRALSAAQYGQSIAPPVVGLDPGSVVDLTVGNSNNAQAAMANRANMYGQQSQNWGQLAGQFGGMALLSYNNSNPGSTTSFYNPSTGALAPYSYNPGNPTP